MDTDTAPKLNSRISKSKDAFLPLWNRAEFDSDIASCAKNSSKNRPSALIMMDIDNFKSINDTYFHTSADEALKNIAEIILRVIDKKGLAYRYGGDELCVLLENFSAEEGRAVAERIRREVEEIEINAQPKPFTVTVSIGVASLSEPSSTDEWKDNADKAMYTSKHAGGNQVSIAAAAEVKPGKPSRLTAEMINDRLNAVELELSIQQGMSANFIVQINNNSSEEAILKKVTLKSNGIKLTEYVPQLEYAKMAAGVRRAHSWMARDPDPVQMLMQMNRTSTGRFDAIIDIDIQAEILGRTRTYSSRIYASIDTGMKRISQIP